MDLEALRDALSTSTSQVLEEAAFAFTEPAEPDTPADWPEVVLRARLTFEGESCGALSLCAPADFCAELATDMVGEADDDEAAEALAELLNMVAGLTLERTFGGRCAWEIGVPEVQRLSAAKIGSAGPPHVCVRLQTDEDAPIEAAAWLHQGDQP